MVHEVKKETVINTRARIFFILAISRYLHKDDYGLSQNHSSRFTDYRNFCCGSSNSKINPSVIGFF
jgi:hypothetical protein